MMGNYYGHMFGWGLGGGLMMIISWAAIVLFIIWVVKEIKDKGSSDTTHSSKTPLDILKERYAKGELSKEQFESMKKDITS